MIRAEVKTENFKRTKKLVVFYEDTVQECKDYVSAMQVNGVEILEANYFDKDQRESDIAEGKV